MNCRKVLNKSVARSTYFMIYSIYMKMSKTGAKPKLGKQEVCLGVLGEMVEGYRFPFWGN